MYRGGSVRGATPVLCRPPAEGSLRNVVSVAESDPTGLDSCADDGVRTSQSEMFNVAPITHRSRPRTAVLCNGRA